MTVLRVFARHKYIGKARDTKPDQDVPAGSTFYECDTGNTYIFDGEKWYKMPAKKTAESIEIGELEEL